MKDKQQIISRFFAPKSDPNSQPHSPSLFPSNASSAPLPSVQWPPTRTSASLRNLQQGILDSVIKKDPNSDSVSRKKRPVSFHGSREDSEPEDLERLGICSGAISSGEETAEGTDLGAEENADLERGRSVSGKLTGYSLGTVGFTYKKRRRTASNSKLQSKRTELDGSEQVFERRSSATENAFCEEQELPEQAGSNGSLSETGLASVSSRKHSDFVTDWKPTNNFVEIPASDPARHKEFVDTLLNSTDREGVVQESRPGKSSAKEGYTPLEQQVVELKAKYKDVLLMVEVGYRYRMFGEDAEAAARVLGIVAYNHHSFLSATIPTYRLHVHVRRLVEAGFKVGVVRQTETAAIKAHGGNKPGPFTRGLSALYSRATIEAAEDLGGGETPADVGHSSSYLICITEQPDIPKSSSKSPSRRHGSQNSGEGDAEAMKRANYDTTIGIIAVDPATGDVMYRQFKDTVMRTELEAHLLTCAPAELLLASPLSSASEKLIVDFAGASSNARVERVPRDSFKNSSAISEVLAFYESKEDTAWSSERGVQSEDCEMEEEIDAGLEAIMAMPDLVVQALALALRYLKQFGLEKVLRLGATFRPFANLCEMSLSSNTLQQLEILQNNADGTNRGSLLWLMDHTYTAFGGRLFHHWLTHPLRDRVSILARLDAVLEIAESMGSVGGTQNEGSFPGSGRGGGFIGAASRGCGDGVANGPQGLLAAVLMSLKKVPDLERGITRIFHRTATAAEFVTVIQALVMAVRQLQRLQLEDSDQSETAEPLEEIRRAINSQLLKRLLAAASSSTVSEHALRLLSFLNKEAAAAAEKHNLFACGNGKFPMVEKCQAAVRVAEQRLDSFLPQYRKSLKMPKLEYMSVSGSTHLIEVPVAQVVPVNWIKVNGTKKTNRYHSPEVLQALDALTLAKEELTVECNKAWDSFLAEFASYYVDFRATIHALAALDCLHSLAIVSRNQGYTRPEFIENEPALLIIEGGRHPVLEVTLQDGFVSNDTCLNAEDEHCQIITGPNMGGKSCYIRQVALIAIMAQIGSYVPAVSAKLHVFDAIYTRMGASDNIQRGSSTFLEELSEASNILRKATSHSLVIMDELGRGTSTHDGVAIAYAVLEYLLKEIRCLTLFVTHYPQLAELRDRFLGKVGAYHVSYLAEASSIQRAGSEAACEQVSTSDDHASFVQSKSCEQSVAEEAAQKVTFLYKLVEGVASRSFGLHVARLAQIPEVCVLRASTMAANLEREVRLRALSVARDVKESDTSRQGTVPGLEKAHNAMHNSGLIEKHCISSTSHVLDAFEDLQSVNSVLRSNAIGIESNKCPEGSEGLICGTSVEKLSELLCFVLLALKRSNPEDAVPVLKAVQEHALSILRA